MYLIMPLRLYVTIQKSRVDLVIPSRPMDEIMVVIVRDVETLSNTHSTRMSTVMNVRGFDLIWKVDLVKPFALRKLARVCLPVNLCMVSSVAAVVVLDVVVVFLAPRGVRGAYEENAQFVFCLVACPKKSWYRTSKMVV